MRVREPATMAEIINLRREKKRKGRAEKERQASLNRVRFGTPTAERKINSARSSKENADLEAKKLDPDRPLDD
jgi:Domain of unknown function (DUF4169)